MQSRYYDPTIGRFINADTINLLLISSYRCKENLYSYCYNNIVNKIDPTGFIGYKSSYLRYPGRVVEYRVITSLNVLWKTFKYKYNVRNGVVRFNFNENNYWNAWWYGHSTTLAEAIYKIVRSINSDYLNGRTVGGISAELFVHWVAYTIGYKRSSSNPVDIGGTRGTGYDSNAWKFETANIICRATQIRSITSIQMQILLKDLARYL